MFPASPGGTVHAMATDERQLIEEEIAALGRHLQELDADLRHPDDRAANSTQ